jgi:hypothetical protein
MHESHSLKDLVEEAKWGTSIEAQKKSIQELGSYGREAIHALEEVKAVTARDEIRIEVEAVLSRIQRDNAAKATSAKITSSGMDETTKSDTALSSTESKEHITHVKLKARKKSSRKRKQNK